MVQLQLEPELEARFHELAVEWQTTESRLLEEIVSRWLEDREDYERGVRSLLSTTATRPIEEICKLSDVAD